MNPFRWMAQKDIDSSFFLSFQENVSAEEAR